MRKTQTLVTRGPMEAIGVAVWPWEVEILRAMYGDSETVEQGPTGPELPIPDAANEFDRIARRYGMHDDAKVPWVQVVYGPFGRGEFARAVQAAAAGTEEGGEDLPPARPAPKLDVDGNRYLRVDEIKAALEQLGVEVPDGKRRAELLEMLDEALTTALEDEGVVAPPGSSRDERFGLLSASLATE